MSLLDIKQRSLYESQPETIWDGGHGWETKGKESPDFDRDGHPDLKENLFNDAMISRLCLAHELQGLHSRTISADHRDVSLRKRVRRSNKIYHDHKDQTGNTSFLVSIHADWFSDRDVSGRKIFIAPNASDWSRKLAYFLDTYLDLCGLPIPRRPKKDGVHVGNFYILRNSHMPAILIESGFMSNEHDLSHLKSEAFRNQFAIAVSSGIHQFYKTNKLIK